MVAWIFLALGWFLYWVGFSKLSIVCVGIFAFLEWKKYLTTKHQNKKDAIFLNTTGMQAMEEREIEEKFDLGRMVGPPLELGMGGPNHQDMLLYDGTYIEKVLGMDPPVEMEDGQLIFAVVVNDNRGYDQIVYQTSTRRMYIFPETLKYYRELSQLIELLKAPDLTNEKFDNLCRSATVIQLHLVSDIWVPESLAPPTNLKVTLPSGQQLTAYLKLPEKLSIRERPLRYLSPPLYELFLNGVTTNLFVNNLDKENIAESPSADTLSILGPNLEKRYPPVYHLYFAGQWHYIDSIGRYIKIGYYAPDIYFDLTLKNEGTCIITVAKRTCSHDSLGLLQKIDFIKIQTSWQSQALQLPVINNQATLYLPQYTSLVQKKMKPKVNLGRYIDYPRELGLLDGPSFQDILLYDGSYIEKVLSIEPLAEIEGGQLIFAEVVNDNREVDQIVYEANTRRIYTVTKISYIHELLQDPDLTKEKFDNLCRSATITQLHLVGDIWAPESLTPSKKLKMTLSSGQQLTGYLKLPKKLSMREDPLRCLYPPLYELFLNDVAINLFVHNLDKKYIAESSSADTLSIMSTNEKSYSPYRYHLYFAGQWHYIDNVGKYIKIDNYVPNVYFELTPQNGGICIITIEKYTYSEYLLKHVQKIDLIKIQTSWQAQPIQLPVVDNQAILSLPQNSSEIK